MQTLLLLIMGSQNVQKLKIQMPAERKMSAMIPNISK